MKTTGSAGSSGATSLSELQNETLTAISGIRVGHWHDANAQTGCTVVLCPEAGCLASGEVRGSSPGTRETALLEPEKAAQRVQAVVLAGGSAFGLASATGVVRWLAEQERGVLTPFGPVPVVPAAVIYDLGVGSAGAFPDAEAGYAAVSRADTDLVRQGRVGAGMGATCGKYLGFDRAQPGGLGSAALSIAGATVAALSVANPLGDIVDFRTGDVVAGAPQDERSLLERFASIPFDANGTNTTLVVVATDARVGKAEAKALAQSAHIGIARVTRPSHTVADGDTSFVLSTETGPIVPLLLLSVAVQEVVAEAILNGARASLAT